MSQPASCVRARRPAAPVLPLVLALLSASLATAAIAEAPHDSDAAHPQAQAGAGSAIPADPGILRRRIAPLAAPADASPEVRVRLDPELGEWTAAARSAVLASQAARIAEPAEVEIRTRRNFPLTLQLVNAWEPRELWQPVFTDDPMPERAPRTLELGNLVLQDYAAPLRETLDRLGRANTLLASATPAGQARTVTCFAPRSDTPVSPTCDVPLQLADATTMPQAPIRAHEPAWFAVGNRSQRPQYIALLVIDTDKRITQVPLQGGNPLAPGAWAQSDGTTAIDNRGTYWLATLASDHPLPADLAHAGITPGDGIGLTVSQHDLFVFPIEPIGGGLDV